MLRTYHNPRQEQYQRGHQRPPEELQDRYTFLGIVARRPVIKDIFSSRPMYTEIIKNIQKDINI